MKKLSVLILVLCIAFSCKKKDATTNTTAPQTVSTLSVDGTPVASLTHNSFISDSIHYGVIAYGANSNPEIQIIFYGTAAPAYGTYQMTNGNVTIGRCSLTLSDTNYHSSATTGMVNVVTSTTAPNNVATFTNIVVSGGLGTHTVSGTITY